MRDAGKQLTMLKTSPPPYLKTQNYLSPDVSRTAAEKVCPGAVTWHNQLTIRPNLESLNSQFQVPEEGFLDHLGSKPIKTVKSVGLCCTTQQFLLLSKEGMKEKQFLEKKSWAGISWAFTTVHFLTFYRAKKEKFPPHGDYGTHGS